VISVARLVALVGLAGLVPFLAGTTLLLLAPDPGPAIRAGFYLYSAGILAFMAGAYWPLAMQLEERSYPLSPMVMLLLSQAFFLLAGLGLLLDGPARALLYGLGFLALYLVDARGLRDYWPAWYLRLRLGLTLAVVICQGLVGLAR
jgi:hypothetical protein|tara:strand:- start:4419 stop:4856 length:438 start_codon:yes stop_codon:yes gene_type:complete